MSACAKCCKDFQIDAHLLFLPEMLDQAGRDFLAVHGVDFETLLELRASAEHMGNGKVKIYHRCAQLDDNNLCTIYETRPGICREYRCETRAGAETCNNQVFPLAVVPRG